MKIGKDMKIKAIRSKVYRWTGPTAPARPNLSVNPMDALNSLSDTMGSFRFHDWLVCEVETDDGIVGIGNCALAPKIAKEIIDQYLAPIAIGRDPFDFEAIWQAMYRSTMAWGRKGIGMAAISAVDIAIWDIMARLSASLSSSCWEGGPRRTFRSMRPSFTVSPWTVWPKRRKAISTRASK
ncbi:hypothetical protein [uncultured Cohaesibacter sp.]|uniref:hypothetical protein n=1 Tax=uncultured Cohaesibacter sp. TaxID=1002546 RepID=UPI002931F46F|nr:hypothetical protein [uncultured Cohaesibacter sp.]